MNREDLEKMIKIAKVMGPMTAGDPEHCNASVRVGGGPNSRMMSLHRCKRPVHIVDPIGQGWCAAHATEDRIVVCKVCRSTQKQGCCCADLTEYGLMQDWLDASVGI